MKRLKRNLILCFPFFLSACVTFPTLESEQVRVVWDDVDLLQKCEHKGTVFGSEGHFYDYWFHADKDMIWGALNQMRIKAYKKNANVLYLYKPFNFASSITMIGNAYLCPNPLKRIAIHRNTSKKEINR